VGVLAWAAVALAPTPAEAQQRPNMRWLPAHPSNYTPRSSRTIRRIVIHTIEGSESSGISWFQNPRSNVSAHFIVAHSGRITQMLRETDRGWHAGVSSVNADSIGIENEGRASRNGWTTAQYNSLAALTSYLVARYRIPVDRRHIVAHSEVRRGKSDPGPHFDWGRFMAMVRGNVGATATPQPNVNPASPAIGGRSRVEITASALNVRSRAWGSVLGTVTQGQRFVVTGRSGSWLRIDYSGRTGWIHANYARASNADAVKVEASSLNVRNGPSTGYGKLGITFRGQAYTVVMRQGRWVLIQFDRRRGWVAGWHTSTLR
jgi:N-acetyl-anhydromuramyl-L-alanine amidase AmpD/uncharacterized protein YraI